jgi:hypothetical protein
MEELLRRHCDIWLYTTSYRSPRYLRGWFRGLGIRLGGVVNQHLHERMVDRQGPIVARASLRSNDGFLLGVGVSRCQLDDAVEGVPKGVVVRSPDRPHRAKLRREDDERILRRRQGRK